MKKYYIGLCIIGIVGILLIPVMCLYINANLADVGMKCKPGWFYTVAMLTAIITAWWASRKSSRDFHSHNPT